MMRCALRRLPLLAGALLLTSCHDTKQDAFHPQGRYAEKIGNLQAPVFGVAIFVGVAVALAIMWVSLAGHRRNKQGGEVKQVHGNTTLEIAWTTAPAIFLLVIGVFTVSTIFELERKPAGEEVMQVAVFGHQWWWSYEYDLDNDGEVDVITANEMVIPAGKTVELRIQSRDVVHSFWVPDLAGTRDAIPGRVHPLLIHANDPGEFEGQCKEFCGLAHANMRARVIALNEQDWEQWKREQLQASKMPAKDTEEYAGAQAFAAKCASCHQINGLKDANGQELPNVSHSAALVAHHAPDLTHLMSRSVFASGEFPLWVPDADGSLVFNRTQFEEWLRNPDAMLPMAADEGRGMPNLKLSETEIKQLTAYLTTLGTYPDGAIDPTTGN